MHFTAFDVNVDGEAADDVTHMFRSMNPMEVFIQLDKAENISR